MWTFVIQSPIEDAATFIAMSTVHVNSFMTHISAVIFFMWKDGVSTVLSTYHAMRADISR